MFAHKAHVTAFVCVLVLLLNIAVVHLMVGALMRATICGAVVVAAIVPGVRRRSLACAVTCVGILVASYFYFVWYLADERAFSLLRLATTATEANPVSFVGTICDTVETASHKQKHLVVDVRAFNIPFSALNRGRLVMPCAVDVVAERGDLIVATGWIRTPMPPPYPWDYSIEPLLRRVGAVATFKAVSTQIIPIRHRPDLRAFIDDLRQRIIQVHVEAIGRTNGNLLTSMVIGNRNVEVDESISDAFRNLGVSHTLAASGFNLSIVVAATWALLRPLIAHRALLNLCAGFLMLIYTALAGPSASIVRAAIMCGGVLFSGAFDRRPDTFAALGSTLVVTTLLDPHALADVGLQLSYVSTLTLMCRADSLCHAIRVLVEQNPIRKVLEIALPCVLAGMSVFPLQLYYFWQVGLLQLPANILIAPLLPIITLEVFATSTLAAVHLSKVAVLVDRLANLPIVVLMRIIEWLNSYTWSVLATGPPELYKVLVFYCFLALALSCASFTSRLCLALLGLLVCGIALMWRPPLPPLTVVRIYRGAIAIDAERNAVVAGDCERYQVRKCLAYFGTHAVSANKQPSGSTAYMRWELRDGNCLQITIRRTQRVVSVRPDSTGHASKLRVYQI